MEGSNTQDLSSLEIALLFESPVEAKKISDSLRNLGLYAHYYSKLDEFWLHLKNQSPDLSIIDVKKISEGDIHLRNHPALKSNKLSLAFYYTESTQVLVDSTFSIPHLGLISGKLNINKQLKFILDNYLKLEGLKTLNRELNQTSIRLKKHVQKLNSNFKDILLKEQQDKKLEKIIESIGAGDSKKEFITQLINVFSNWDSVKSFGLYYVEEDSYKLKSLKAIRSKYKELPELWPLSRSPENRDDGAVADYKNYGMGEFEQEMVHEVGHDFIDKKAKMINVHGASELPEVIIMADFDESGLKFFDWNLLERELHYKYLTFLRNEQNKLYLKNASGANKESTIEISIWEAFNYLDEVHFHKRLLKHKCIDVNFSSLIETIKNNQNERFFWESFFNDFKTTLTQRMRGNFKFSVIGPQNILLFLDTNFIGEDFKLLKDIVQNFQFWRYFENSSIIMSQPVKPHIKIIAPASVHYLRQMALSNSEVGFDIHKSRKVIALNDPFSNKARSSVRPEG